MPIKFFLRCVIPLSIFMFLSLKSAAQQTGFACIYSKNLCGGKTASGERFDCDKLTAAHLKLKMGAKIQVTNLENGKTVVVKINDRGPYSKKYILDLSPAAAKKIGLTYQQGRAKVKWKQL